MKREDRENHTTRIKTGNPCVCSAENCDGFTNPKQENIDKKEWRCSSHPVNECKMLLMQRAFKKHDEDKKVCVCECKCKFVQNMEGNETLIYTPKKNEFFQHWGEGGLIYFI